MAHGQNSGQEREAMLRRVAIVLSSLPPTVASKLIGSIAPTSKQDIRRVMTSLEDVDPLERRRAFHAFKVSVEEQYHTFGPDPSLERQVPNRHPASDTGPTHSGLNHPGTRHAASANATAGASAGANHKGTTAASRVMAGDSVRQHSAPLNLASDGASVTPMSFLDDVEDQVLLQLLKGEHPQTIAVVLASIRPEQAGRILPQLDARTQTETLHRIGRLDGFPDAAITEVAEHFKQRIVEQTNLQTASPGRNALDAILAAMPAQASSQSNHSVATAVQPTQAPPPAVFPSADEPQQDLAHKIRLAEHTLPDTIDEGGDDHQHHPSVRPASSRGTASDRSTSGGRNNPSPLHSTDSIHNHLQTMAAAKLCEALGRVDTRVAMLASAGCPVIPLMRRLLSCRRPKPNGSAKP